MSRTLRKPYTKSKRFDSTCRNHGSCNYCKATRTHTEAVRARISAEKYNDWENLDYLEEWEIRLIELEALDKCDQNADNCDTALVAQSAEAANLKSAQ